MCNIRILIIGLTLTIIGTTARAAECPGNPDALGTSRTLVVDPTEHARVGAMQYGETLPLADKEVVLTFDDGPLPPYTNRVLEILAAQCVKATYFIVGKQAKAYPDMVRRLYEAGHTIGTHSQTHPFTFNKMPVEKAAQEVDDGIASTATAVGDPAALAPFFRIPGLLRADQIETYLASHGLMTWSADFVADDWRKIRPSEIVRRAMERLDARGKGILLLHDIHPATVLALPALLKELKQRGYRIVQVVPAAPDRQKTVTEASQWAVRGSTHGRTPVLGPVGMEDPGPPVPSSSEFALISPALAEPAVSPSSEPQPRYWPLTFTSSWPSIGVP